MTNHKSDTDDGLEESNGARLSRRQTLAVLGSIAGGGGATLGAIGATSDPNPNASLGGGPMADQAAELRAQLYEGPESDLPDAGVNGRYYRVTSGGTNYDAGDFLEDTGDAWVKTDLGVDSVTTDGASIGATVDAANYDGATGGQQIQAAVDDFGATPCTVVVRANGPDDLSGYSAADRDSGWLIDSTLSLPSFTTLVLEGSYLFLDNNVDDQIITNNDYTNGNRDIAILGQGAAHIDGNPTNQTRTTRFDLVGIAFVNVSGITMKGFAHGPTNCWGILTEDATNCRAHDIEFRQTGSTQNQDGWKTIGPASNIVATHLSGTFGDDVVSAQSAEEAYGSGGEVKNVTYSNITAEAVTNVSSLVRTTPESGKPISGVTASNMTIEGNVSNVLKIGWEHTPTQPTADEHRNINISNVTAADTKDTAVYVGSPVQDLRLSDFDIRTSGSGILTNGYNTEGLTLSNFNVRNDAGKAPVYLQGGTHDKVRIDGGTWIRENDPDNAEGLVMDNSATINSLHAEGVTMEEYGSGVFISSNSTLNGTVRFKDFDFINMDSSFYWNFSQEGVLRNGIAEESASAEEPQLTYPAGAEIDFIDSGDGSGTGYYKRLPDGTFTQLA